MVEAVEFFSPEYEHVTAVSSGTKTVIFDNAVTVIGERINPTGKKKLKEKLRQQDFGYLVSEAISQMHNSAVSLTLIVACRR